MIGTKLKLRQNPVNGAALAVTAKFPPPNRTFVSTLNGSPVNLAASEGVAPGTGGKYHQRPISCASDRQLDSAPYRPPGQDTHFHLGHGVDQVIGTGLGGVVTMPEARYPRAGVGVDD